MRTLLNVLWFVLGGWISLIAWGIAGALLAITIVGLPWTLAAFRMAVFSAAPFGRYAVPKALADADAAPSGCLDAVLNVIWFLLAGWWLALHHLVLAVALFITVIGIPFGIQHLKLAGLSLSPVGVRIARA